MKFDKYLKKFIDKNVYEDLYNKNAFEFFYSELYFRTTEELQMYRSILKAKMIRNNSTTIFLSLIALFSSFSIAFINLIKDIFEEEIKEYILVGSMALFFVFITVYIIYLLMNEVEVSLTGKSKKMSLIIEVIDKILSEREKNDK